jgi:thioredoxin reductase (NADPH)
MVYLAWPCLFLVALLWGGALAQLEFAPDGSVQEDLGMDFAPPTDEDFDAFFDSVVIPQRKRLEGLDPRETVSSANASKLAFCASNAFTSRLVEADHKVIVVGAGPAGLSAAIYAARADMQPLVVSKDGGQLESTSWIDNYPGFEDGVDAVDMILRLNKQAERFGAKFKECEITIVDVGCRPFKVACAGGEVMTSSALIIATGASAKWLGAKGEQKYLSKGVHTCATCDGFFYKDKHAAVIGGGDTAMEQALFLARLARKVTIIHRRDSFRASKAMASRAVNHPNIEILWNTVVAEFKSEDGKKLSHLQLTTMDEDGNENITQDLEVDGAFVAVGHIPNTQLFQDVKKNDEGYIYTIPGTTMTSVTGVYAAGDAQDSVYRQAITSAGTGAMAAIDAERWLCEHGC